MHRGRTLRAWQARLWVILSHSRPGCQRRHQGLAGAWIEAGQADTHPDPAASPCGRPGLPYAPADVRHIDARRPHPTEGTGRPQAVALARSGRRSVRRGTRAPEPVIASHSLSATRGKEGLDPWDALDAAQKVAAIQRLIRVELARVLPQILR